MHIFITYLLILIVRARDYKYISWGNLVDIYQQWAREYPEVLELVVANDKYKIPAAGTCRSSSGQEVPCKVYILELTEKSSLPSDNSRPAVFFSGSIHGNEEPGVIAVVEFARLLLENYKKKEPNPWLLYLLKNRRIVLAPSLNSWGYDHERREEINIDPNRDFPYDQVPNRCMQSITARIANELFLENIFVTGLTFHGGTTSISHEWGDFFHNSPRSHSQSPDHNAMHQIADALSKYAGKDERGRHFPFQTINEAVYPVHGGMEDWAYGASWMNQYEKKASTPCQPGTNGGYPREKTEYKDSHFRSVFMLVEVHDLKKPSERILGNDQNLFQPGNTGLVSRLIRQIILMTDIAQPYVILDSVSNSSVGLSVRWRVMGAFNVDETFAIAVDDNGKEYRSATTSGLTNWNGNIDLDPSQPNAHHFFFGRIKVPDGTPVKVTAYARVDGFWAKERKNFPGGPQIPPQSHLVNARTNENWDHTLPKSHVKGYLLWKSDPKPVTPKHRISPSFQPFFRFMLSFIFVSCLIFGGLQIFTTTSRPRRFGFRDEDRPFRNIELGDTSSR